MTTDSIRAQVHAKCAHKRYRLNCEQIDELRTEADGRCQICGKLERYAGMLRIDHDHKLGLWAVRGLLCTPCNMGLERGFVEGPEVDAYLANPWYLRLPGADAVEPEADEDFPLIDMETAYARVTEAAEIYRVTRGPRERERRADLIRACRAARKIGWRTREISQATNRLWGTEHVALVCTERIEQPKQIPTARMEATS